MFTPLLEKLTPNKRLVAAADFVLTFFFIYFIWKVISYFSSLEGTTLHSAWISLNNWLAAQMTLHTAFILKTFLGHELIFNKRNVVINGTEGFYVANHCLGIAPMVIFAGLILAYQGRWMLKLWYIPFGMFCIYAINVARLVALGATQECCAKIFFELAHSSVYLLMSYGMFFLLVIWWMNVFSKK